MIVSDAFERINEGDYLVYSDSGTYYVNSIMLLIEFMEKKREEILVFDIPFIEKYWTKRDVFVRLKCDDKEYTETNQRMSTIFVLKKGKLAREFVNRYLNAAMQYPDIFTDEQNICGKCDYAEFIENRHNQSVLSVITNFSIEAVM